jgi:hypothetical protein
MPKKRHSAHDGDAQATTQAVYRRAPDVAAFIAEHGVTVCSPGQASKKLTKPIRGKARRLHAQCWTVRRAIWKKKSQAELKAWVKRTAVY